MVVGSNVTDGYFSYIIIAIANDGWATCRMIGGHTSRIRITDLRINQ